MGAVSIRETPPLKEQCAPGNAIPSHSVELVRFCIECNNSPSNGNGGMKNSCTFSPVIGEDDPEDPSPGEFCASSAWIWPIFRWVTFLMTGDIDNLLGVAVLDTNEDGCLGVGFRV
jgi:hypothetical protein